MNIPLLSIHNWVHRQDPQKLFEFVPGLDPKTRRKLIDNVKRTPIAKRKVRA